MEKVNHPTHYNIPGRKECIEEIAEKYGMVVAGIFCLTNSYKYLYRAGIKEGESQGDDVKKAKWYFDWITAPERVKQLNSNNMDWKLFKEVSELCTDMRKGLERYEEE